MTYLESPKDWRPPTPTGHDLVAIAAQHAQQRSERLMDIIGRATLFVATHEDTDTIVVHGRDGGHWVDAYSDHANLPDARAGREEIWHRVVKGSALRAELAPTIGVVLDRGHLHEMVIYPPGVALIPTTDHGTGTGR